MVLHKHVDGVDTIFTTMLLPLVKNPLGGCLRVIRIGSYQSSVEESRWTYETVSDFCPDK